MRECRERSGIIHGDEALTIFIPGLDFIPSDVHMEDACRVCRYVLSVASIPIHNSSNGPQAISQKHSRRLCERHSALHRDQTESRSAGWSSAPTLQPPPAVDRSSLRGRVDTAGRMGGSADLLAFDHLARERGCGKHFEIVRGKTGIVNPRKQDVQLLRVLMLFP